MRFFLAALMGFVSPLLTACDEWALFINSDGVLSITIVSDGYAREGFRVRARQSDQVSRTVDVPASGNLELEGFSQGALEVTLMLPSECRVASPNPQTFQVSAKETISAEFQVHCHQSLNASSTRS